MKQSAKLAIAKPTITATPNQKISSASLLLPISPTNAPVHSQLTSHFFPTFLHTISTSKTSQTGLSVFFFIMGIVLMVKVFHHF